MFNPKTTKQILARSEKTLREMERHAERVLCVMKTNSQRIAALEAENKRLADERNNALTVAGKLRNLLTIG